MRRADILNVFSLFNFGTFDHALRHNIWRYSVWCIGNFKIPKAIEHLDTKRWKSRLQLANTLINRPFALNATIFLLFEMTKDITI